MDLLSSPLYLGRTVGDLKPKGVGLQLRSIHVDRNKVIFIFFPARRKSILNQTNSRAQRGWLELQEWTALPLECEQTRERV